MSQVCSGLVLSVLLNNTREIPPLSLNASIISVFRLLFSSIVRSYAATLFFSLLILPLALTLALPLALCTFGLSGRTQSPSLSGPFEDALDGLDVFVIVAEGMSLTIVPGLWIVVDVACTTLVSIGAGVLAAEEGRDRRSVMPVDGVAETVDM